MLDLYWAKFCGWKNFHCRHQGGLFHHNSHYSTIIPANNSTQSSYRRLSVHIWQYGALSSPLLDRFAYDLQPLYLQFIFYLLDQQTDEIWHPTVFSWQFSLLLLPSTFHLPPQKWRRSFTINRPQMQVSTVRLPRTVDCSTGWASEYWAQYHMSLIKWQLNISVLFNGVIFQWTSDSKSIKLREEKERKKRRKED